jgi:hypothetical protein
VQVRGVQQLGYSYLGTFSPAEALPPAQAQAPDIVALFHPKDGAAASLAAAYVPTNLAERTLIDVSPKGAGAALIFSFSHFHIFRQAMVALVAALLHARHRIAPTLTAAHALSDLADAHAHWPRSAYQCFFLHRGLDTTTGGCGHCCVCQRLRHQQQPRGNMHAD